MHRAVFLDRDGVICWNRYDHVKSWDEFEFLPGVREALARLAGSDLCIVVVTNQAVVNRGMATLSAIEEIHTRMVSEIEQAGGRVDKVMFCPHRPDQGCECRKPKPGMLLKAAAQLDLDLTGSYTVGDACSDVMAGRAAGCARCYLALTGRGVEQLSQCYAQARGEFQVVRNLEHAVRDILVQEAALV
jgi:D-glycero-D-manno-heptose 1,7-bisphosphate phosphatase